MLLFEWGEKLLCFKGITLIGYLRTVWEFLLLKSYQVKWCLGQPLKNGQELRKYKGYHRCVPSETMSPVWFVSWIFALVSAGTYEHIPLTTYLAIPHTVQVQGHVVKVLLFTMHLHNATKRIVNTASKPRSLMFLPINGKLLSYWNSPQLNDEENSLCC